MSSRTLATLIEMAREARDQAAQLLANDMRSGHELASRIEILQRYRNEYNTRLVDAMTKGIDLATLRDYQGFLASLDGAIANAQGKLTRQREKESQSRQQWIDQQRQVSSFDTLANRRALIKMREEQRLELRLNDEQTNNKYARGINSGASSHSDQEVS